MKLRVAILAAAGVLFSLLLASYFFHDRTEASGTGLGDSATWLSLASPGKLSVAHAFLEHSCSDCHTPIEGVRSENCIQCHANAEAIIQRQPTAFHADIGSCRECHLEHMGRDFNPSTMDHDALARTGIRDLESDEAFASLSAETAALLNFWLDYVPAGQSGGDFHPNISRFERMLDCTSCHQNDDRHGGLFGGNCASCHETSQWNIAAFRHPAASSMDCAQCHKAPPSHYMGHFNMISAKVAGKPHARVDQCFACHQTTSWNDIKGVGWYKHH